VAILFNLIIGRARDTIELLQREIRGSISAELCPQTASTGPLYYKMYGAISGAARIL